MLFCTPPKTRARASVGPFFLFFCEIRVPRTQNFTPRKYAFSNKRECFFMKIQLFHEKEQHFQEMHTFCAPVRKRQYSLGIIDGFGGALVVENWNFANLPPFAWKYWKFKKIRDFLEIIGISAKFWYLAIKVPPKPSIFPREYWCFCTGTQKIQEWLRNQPFSGNIWFLRKMSDFLQKGAIYMNFAFLVENAPWNHQYSLGI